MKKKLITITLALAMIIGSMTFSFAGSSFTDIKDEQTATAVEVLKLMGVVDGIGDGKYNPDGKLTRAEFCKLAVISMHTDADFNKYSSMTIFPDVRASQWFAPYVNMAAKELSIVKGMPDGTFKPDNNIKSSEAITILLRLIGYTDEEIGGVWPYGHINFAKDSGMLSGIKIENANDPMSRGDAAKLFVNTIKMDAQNKRSTFSLSNETTLKSVNVGSKTLTTSSGQVYQTAKSLSSSGLVGKTGYVVTRTKDGKAVSFIPKTAIASGLDVCVVIKKAGDSSALTALAGRSDYTIYKNGALVTADKLAANDVAIYRADENKILVCDTKLSVMYEGVSPNPAAPSVVKVLNGKEFDVLSSAESLLAGRSLGNHISLYLTADGKIGSVGSVGYTTTQNNAVFVVDTTGKADMICGGEVLDLDIAIEDQSLWGKAVRLNFVNGDIKNPRLSFVELNSNIYGTLNKDSKRVGKKSIADNALIFENGEPVALEDLSITKITYTRLNANDEIDLIVCYDPFGGKIVTGLGTAYTMDVPSKFSSETYPESHLTIVNDSGSIDKVTTYYDEGTRYVLAHDNGRALVDVKELKYSGSVQNDAFVGGKLVNLSSGETLAVYENVTCHNKDLDTWTDLDDALAYGRGFTLYALDGVVYVITYSY